jgi:hypothetical protein
MLLASEPLSDRVCREIWEKKGRVREEEQEEDDRIGG